MKSNKGQALLEFILILPVFLMLFLGIIDFGRVLYEKNRLENVMSDAVDMINDDFSVKEINEEINNNYHNKYALEIKEEGQNKIIEISTLVDIYTPGLESILNDPYKVETTRVIYNE